MRRLRRAVLLSRFRVGGRGKCGGRRMAKLSKEFRAVLCRTSKDEVLYRILASFRQCIRVTEGSSVGIGTETRGSVRRRGTVLRTVESEGPSLTRRLTGRRVIRIVRGLGGVRRGRGRRRTGSKGGWSSGAANESK